MKPNITFLTYDFPPLSGGIARYIHEIARHMRNAHLRIVGVPHHNYQEFDRNQSMQIDRLRLPKKWAPFDQKLKYLAPFYLNKLLFSDKVDFVLCGQAHYSLLIPAWINKKLRGIPYGIVLYGLEILGTRQRRLPGLYYSILTQADLVIAISQQTSALAQSVGVPAENIIIIQPPVDVNKLGSRLSTDEIVHKYHLEGKKIILTVGRLVERKGHDTVIKALPLLITEHPNVHYAIVGSGPHKNELHRLVKELQLEDFVTFVGYVPDDELSAYYQASSVFAMISRDIPETGDMEGFGIVYVEANLFGLPVVAGNSGGVTDAVVHNETGLLVDPNSPSQVADAIKSLLADKTLAQKLTEGGKIRARQKFDGAAAAQAMLIGMKSRINQ